VRQAAGSPASVPSRQIRNAVRSKRQNNCISLVETKTESFMKGKRDGRLSRKARILLTAGIVAAVLLGAWFGVQAWRGYKVTELLESAPLNLDGSAYVADVRKTRVDMARRSVTLYGVSIRTQKHSHNRRNGPVPVLEASAARISASGVHFRRERDILPAGLRIRNIEVE